ncbi:hypothetical protein CALCODRAFT_487585 [Calocera cornea HHB12733]|uniref:DUF6533 domain-containing protein n=1 Tax=Calocera cornea HHB12733 TaxID=1353952 RepID=A0A165D117_9BASI|nr:hypothetical protein CALCODRAFT_487585 [Calocera cornea HHB12733]
MSAGPLLDEQAVANAFATSYIEAAAMTALVYDHLLTLSREVELIWKSSFSLVKLLFLINRYSVLGVMLMQTCCRNLFFAVSVWQLVSAGGISPFLLFLRVWSIYGRTRTVQVVVGGLCAANFLAILVTASVNIWALLGNVYYAPQVDRCVCTERPPWMWTVWVAPLLYETVIFGMIAYKTWAHMREDVHTPIITTLWRDGILYYTVLVAVRVYTILAWLVAPPSLFFMAIYLMLATITTMASRTILHLRAAARQRDSVFLSHDLWTQDEQLVVLPPVSEWLGLRVMTWPGTGAGGDGCEAGARGRERDGEREGEARRAVSVRRETEVVTD